MSPLSSKETGQQKTVHFEFNDLPETRRDDIEEGKVSTRLRARNQSSKVLINSSHFTEPQNAENL
jgi:hypothetical protein